MSDDSRDPAYSILGPLQLRIMHIAWRKGAVTVMDIATALNGESNDRRRAYTTFLTVMRNLARRGLLLQTPGPGRAHTFTAAIDESGYKSQVIKRIVADYCDGDIERMITYATMTG